MQAYAAGAYETYGGWKIQDALPVGDEGRARDGRAGRHYEAWRTGGESGAG